MQRTFISFFALAALGSSALAQTAPDPGTAGEPPTTNTPPVAPTDPTQPEQPEQPKLPGHEQGDMVAPPPDVKPAKPDDKGPVVGKWSPQLYGFVEFDMIGDTTQGFNDLAGNAAIARPNSYTGDHGQLTFGARNSRLGFKLGAPEYDSIKASAQLEMDFLGNQPTGISEAAFFQNPTFRFRHYNLKLETPYVNILIGQYWQLFGWQSNYHPNTVDIQGIPGQVYSRAPQIRISKTFKSDAVDVEIAVAASRPPERDSATPDGQAGVRFMINKWKALHTAGGSGTSIDPGGIGVSGVVRHFAVDELSSNPINQVTKNVGGFSIDALIPIVPATAEHKANALTLTGSFVNGEGIADLYTGLSGGVSNPAPPNPSMTVPAPTYTPNVDGGLVMFLPNGELHPIHWQSYMAGVQYYLPPSGRVWVSGNYTHMHSDNAHLYGGPTKVWDTSDWFDGNLFVDLTPAVRLGAEYANFAQTYVDGIKATNQRFQFSAFFIF